MGLWRQDADPDRHAFGLTRAAEAGPGGASDGEAPLVARDRRTYNKTVMREGIHPKYVEAVVTCACGETFTTRSTKPEIHLEICSKCHPFFTGKQKLVDTAGRVERFQRKYAKKQPDNN